MKVSKYIHGVSEAEYERLTFLNEWLNPACLQTMDLQTGQKVIDVGCGTGILSLEMAQKVGTKGQVLGIERSQQQIQFAEKNRVQKGEGLPLSFRVGDASQLPLRQDELQFFDVAFSRFLIEHIRNPIQVIHQMKRALKPGGKIIIADDDHETFKPTPEPPGFRIIWEAFLRSFDRLGNDPYIGRKLVALLHEGGCQNIENTLIFFGGNAHQPNFSKVADNLIGILLGAKALMLEEALIDEPTFNQCMQAIYNWKEKPDAALWYGMCWASGEVLR